MHIKIMKAIALVELIVVITILAILGTIAFISLQWYSAQARDSRRISDIWNIKKSLELFILYAWKYPIPDSGFQVNYNTDLVRTQWVLWDNVTTNLSNNLNEKPNDPLTEIEYTYSVTNSQTSYELLSIYESDLISKNNLLNKTLAEQVYPKIDWTYNWIYVKTDNYYVATPSIINSEVEWSNMILDWNNIKSQVITWISNLPSNWWNNSQTGALQNLKLSVYTWTILINDTQKTDLWLALQEAYTWSELANIWVYSDLLSTPESELANYVDLVVLKNLTVSNTSTTPEEEPSIDWYPWCDTANIELLNWQVWSACNLWTNTAWTWTASYWKYFQWWNNAAMTTSSPTSTTLVTLATLAWYWNWVFYEDELYIYWWSNWYEWFASWKEDLWWSITDTNTARQWPCADWWHVPSTSEWEDALTEIAWTTSCSDSTCAEAFQNKLLLPFAWYIQFTDATMTDETTQWHYWSSDLVGWMAWACVHVKADQAYSEFIFNSAWASLRCIKD